MVTGTVKGSQSRSPSDARRRYARKQLCHANQADVRRLPAVCPSVRFSVGRRDSCAPERLTLSEPSKPSASGYFAPYPGGDITPLAESGNITAGSCTYRQAIDNPHISRTAPLAASVHGYWKQIAGTCPSTANVDTYLQAYWCDPFGCRWTGVASDSGNVRPGGGGGRRVTARRTCSSSSRTVG
jgi:hypothetical protein